MLNIAIPKEITPLEYRIPILPNEVEKLTKLGIKVAIESGIGESLLIRDEDYSAKGATIEKDRISLLKNNQLILYLNPIPADDIAHLVPHTIIMGHLDPFFQQPLIENLSQKKISVICMEMIPRTTIAQKMDALSSQASLAGYAAVILAADRLNKAFPMMMTPAGTISPSRVFIIGAGVAGLQAIATAKRLGARVEAFDTRPVVAEQVQSLGAKFIKIDLGETGQTAQGYAKALTEEQIAKQQAEMAKRCAMADVVITTAKLFGRKAPIIITTEMLKGMQAGSLVIDLAVETGGNVEGVQLNEEVLVNGVRVIGLGNLPAQVAYHASQMYGSNLRHFIEHFWDQETQSLSLDLDDEIMAGALICHEGNIRSDLLRRHYDR